MVRFGCKKDYKGVQQLYKSYTGKELGYSKMFPCLLDEVDGKITSVISFGFSLNDKDTVKVKRYVMGEDDISLLRNFVTIFSFSNIEILTGRYGVSHGVDLLKMGFDLDIMSRRSWVSGINCRSMCCRSMLGCGCSESRYVRRGTKKNSDIWFEVGGHSSLSIFLVSEGVDIEIGCINFRRDSVYIDTSKASFCVWDFLITICKRTDAILDRFGRVLDCNIYVNRVATMYPPVGYELVVENVTSRKYGKRVASGYVMKDRYIRYNLYKRRTNMV